MGRLICLPTGISKYESELFHRTGAGRTNYAAGRERPNRHAAGIGTSASGHRILVKLKVQDDDNPPPKARRYSPDQRQVLDTKTMPRRLASDRRAPHKSAQTEPSGCHFAALRAANLLCG